MITPGMTKRKRSEHYVNNKEFLAALVQYRENVEVSYMKNFSKDLTEQDKSERAKYWPGKPPIPRYIGECFLKIANHLSFKPNFVNYMFKEDMISDGIENCVQYAFLRRIQREKRQLEIKNKIIERSGYSEVFDDSNTLDGSNYSDYNSIKDAVHSKLRN
jgi:hypothetical protein